MQSNNNSLSIVIPIYNEEKAVEEVIKKVLKVKLKISNKSRIKKVEIVVVNDGSIDNTAKILSKFKDIKLIDHKVNKGYGSAIKTGIKHSLGKVIAFLDADATYDPAYLIPMLKELDRSGSEMIVGTRFKGKSKMTVTRKIGNRYFVLLLNLLAHSNLSDCTSGMRIVKKSVLRKLSPLPDGWDFTPEMSAKAAFTKSIRVVEVPISYEDRIGQSKQKIIKGGLIITKCIIRTAFLTYKKRLEGKFRTK
jgi:glycosyltransferase involved in cell wall biosynthesis